jgi:hypothetical protein
MNSAIENDPKSTSESNRKTATSNDLIPPPVTIMFHHLACIINVDTT